MLGKYGSSAPQKEMLKNLDILAYESLTNEYLQEYPSIEKAKKTTQSELVRDADGNPLPLSCSLNQFRKYGPGVFLTFFFMKYLLIVMGVLLPFPLVNLVISITQEEHFIGTNVQTAFETTTISSLHSLQNLIISFNFIVVFMLTLSIIYWKHLQTNEVLKCTKITCLSSYFTVIMKNIPNYYREHDLREYLEKHYGKVHEIYTPRDYEGDLIHYKEMQNILEEFKEERQVFIRNRQTTSCLPLIAKFLSYRALHQRLTSSIVQNKHYEPYCAFITFENIPSKYMLLDNQSAINSCCMPNKVSVISSGEDKLYKDQALEFKSCKMEPDGIIWENLNMPVKEKFLRCAFILFLMGLFLFLAIITFGIFAGAEASLFAHDFGHLTYEDAVNSQNPQKIKSFCIALSITNFSNYPECKPYFNSFVSSTVLYISFPLVIIFMKMLFALLMKKLVVLRKHKDEVHRVCWKITILTIFYIITCGGIKWFIYRSFNFFGVKFQLLTMFVPILRQVAKVIPIQPNNIFLFSDFDKAWVAHASHKVILVAIFSYNIVILIYLFSNIGSKKCNQSSASSEPTQKKMKQKLRGQIFNIQFLYAETLTIFLFCMLYFSVMPLIYPLTFLSLLLFYWVAKYKLLRVDKKPPFYAHSISQLVTRYTFFGLAINCLVSPIYYGNMDGLQNTSWLERYATYWYYIVNFIIIILFSFFQMPIIEFYYFTKNKLLNCLSERQDSQRYANRLNSMKVTAGGLQSYSMHNNPEYTHLLKVLYTINRKQMHHMGYFAHSQIEQIRASVLRPDNDFLLFNELYEFIEIETELIKNKPKTSRNIKTDPKQCSHYMKLMTKIREEAFKELEEEHKYNQLYKTVQSKIKQYSSLKNSNLKSTIEQKWLSKQKRKEIKEQIKILDEQPQITDNRLRPPS